MHWLCPNWYVPVVGTIAETRRCSISKCFEVIKDEIKGKPSSASFQVATMILNRMPEMEERALIYDGITLWLTSHNVLCPSWICKWYLGDQMMWYHFRFEYSNVLIKEKVQFFAWYRSLVTRTIKWWTSRSSFQPLTQVISTFTVTKFLQYACRIAAYIMKKRIDKVGSFLLNSAIRRLPKVFWKMHENEPRLVVYVA